ncbi:MAG: hypothetical protein HY660_04765, partial [Armatimonadetes bacterium]|nr:hypothetical protein [Armatimonadota bacterium]
MRVALLIVLLAAGLLSGCRPRAQTSKESSPPPPSPPPSAASPGGILQLPGATLGPSQPQVGIVDLTAVARVHPRWPALETLSRDMEALQIQIAAPPPPPPLPRFDFEAILREEAERLRVLLQGEVAALRAQAQRELDEYLAEQSKAQEARLQELRKALEEELKRDVEARQRAAQAEVNAFEGRVLEEYRLPLLNLRLKLQTVQFTSREESERLVKEFERLQAERSAKIKTHEQEVEAALNEDQKKR